MDIKQCVAAHEEELIALRRHFHAHPELGLQEFLTAQAIENYLTEQEISVRRCAGTGVIGVLQGGLPGKTVMLRADIDALPVKEETGLPFASETPGIAHACGHDGHTAMLMITAKILAEHREELHGNVVFLFQTNEECMGGIMGAERMIQDGALENPVPDAIFGLHLWSPIASGKIGVVAGPIMASSYFFKITIHGKGGHGGAPHTAINPIDSAGHVLSAIKTFLSLEMDACLPTVISVCKIHGGDKEVIVPEEVELEGSIRCLHNHHEAVHRRFRELVTQICQVYRCTCTVDIVCSNSLLSNDPQLVQMVMDVTTQQFGADHLQCDGVSVMLGDDFAELIQNIPGAYFFVGTGNPDKKTDYEHHHPCFNIDEETLSTGVEMEVGLVLRYLNGT